MVNIDRKFAKVVDKMKFNSSPEKMVFENRLMHFLENDSYDINKIKLLKIVSKINWISTKEINDYIFQKTTDLLDDNVMIYKFKNALTSSSNNLISSISYAGMCSDEQVLNNEDIIKKDISSYHSLLIIDDYSGSGDTIIKGLKKVLPYIKSKKIYVVLYAVQSQALEKIHEFQKEESLNLEVFQKKELETYEYYLDKNTKLYADFICDKCLDYKIKYGWGNTGALVSINMCSPNNNISMIWSDKIEYNDNVWIPLLDREIGFIMQNKRYKNQIKKMKVILENYFNNDFSKNYKEYDISYNEFEFLIYTYRCYMTPEELISNNYIQNLHEFDNFTKNLRKNNIIELKNGYVIIKNEDIHRYIKAITLKITAEQSGFKKNTRKEDIGK